MEQIGEKTSFDQAIQISWEDFHALFKVECLVNGIEKFFIDPSTQKIKYNYYVSNAETGEDFLTLHAKYFGEKLINEIPNRLNIQPTDELQKLRNEIFEKEKE